MTKSTDEINTETQKGGPDDRESIFPDSRQNKASYAAITEISSLDELERFAPIWKTLYDACSCPSPFASFEWLQSWWRFFRPFEDEGGTFDTTSPGGQRHVPLLMVAAVSASGNLIGLAPFYLCVQDDTGIPLRVLRLVGEMQPWAPNPSEEPIVLLKRAHEKEAATAILTCLRRARRRSGLRWDYVSFSHYSSVQDSEEDTDPTPRPFAAFQGVKVASPTTTEMVSLPASWEIYRRSLSKSMRDNLAYYPRLLSRHGHSWKVRVARYPDEVREAADILSELHRVRSQSTHSHVSHIDHLPTRLHRDFFRDALSRLAAQGTAAVWLLEANGRAIGAQAILESSEGQCFYYSGFDPGWHRYSPLTILSAEILKDAIVRGISRINLFPTQNSWKSRWGAVSQPRHQRVVLFPLIPNTLARGALYGLARIVARAGAIAR